MNLFHPKTVDDTFESTDDSIAEGIKDENGNWNHKGQKDRLLTINNHTLEIISKIFAGSSTSPILPDIHSNSLLTVLRKFSSLSTRLCDLGNEEYRISLMWDENAAQKDGTITEFPNQQTIKPQTIQKAILNGPHLSTGNPFFKTPRNPCKNNLDWVSIDLELLPDDFVPRCKFIQSCDDITYSSRQVRCKWDNLPIDQHWRLAYRAMVGLDSERSLTGTLYPPGVGHISKVYCIAFKSPRNLLAITSLFASLPADAYIRILGKSDLHDSVIKTIPVVRYRNRESAANIRLLSLTCLTSDYIPLWNSLFKEEFLSEQWTQSSIGITSNWFSLLTSKWSRNCSLRSDLMRRQALLELDVLTAQAMGLDLKDLLTLYRLRFRVMRDYEANTWYDQKGRIVFTTNAALPSVGLPRKKRVKDSSEGITYRVNGYAVDTKGLGFEDVKNMKEGFVEKTFPDMSMTDEPVMTTVRYEAPFFQMDREADYRRAWEVFEKRFGKVGDEGSAPTTEPPSAN